MHQHARPHIETHTRTKGHSAVAGAAYRLGLKLYDERQKVWHDFRKRALGEEVVRALTIAPPGAPAWASDPAQLWNKVEASEKRKDSQLARDYRIPIPFGLDDSDARDLAEEMARFIVETLHTPVSLGLHRDVDRDALGELKPKDKQGFHAHIYFPSRRLPDAVEGDEGKDGSCTDFGAKLTVLSNKNTSATFVEMLNCKWSELATDYARKNGSDLTFQFKSYKRLGLNLTPQPTLGRSATAMERRGLYTNRGDTLREALVMAKVYEKAHASTLTAQHAQAVRDVAREASKRSEAQPEPARVASSKASMVFAKWKSRGGQPIISPRGSLAYRLKASAPSPKTKEEHEELERSLVLVEALDKAFAVYHELMQQLDEVMKTIEVARAAKLDAEFQADQSRGRRSAAKVRLAQWEEDHRWRVRMFASMGGAPLPEHEQLRQEVRRHDEHVQSLKQTIARHAQDVVNADQEASILKAKQADVLSTIRGSLVKLHDMASPLLPEMIKALPSDDRALVKQELPIMLEATEPSDEANPTGLAPAPAFKSRAFGKQPS